VIPVSVCEEKLQSHDEGGPASLMAVDHAGKTLETALQGPHVEALVGSPPLFSQNGRSVETYVPGSRDFVGDQVQAGQRDGDLQRRTSLSTA
jgi:hypothetical protein